MPPVDVRTSSGETITINVEGTDTLLDVKQKILARLKEDQRSAFTGSVLPLFLGMCPCNVVDIPSI
jgi:hypothetical protein